MPRAEPGRTAAPGDVLPAPRALPPFGPDQVRLPRLPNEAGPLGCMPRATPKSLDKCVKYVQELVDPEACLKLVCGRTRLMILRGVLKRIQVADDNIAGYHLLAPNEVSLLGKCVGTTVLTLWFTDPADNTRQEVLTYQVCVVPDPELKERMDRVYKCLADEINHAFPDSNICLQLVGDKLVVTGSAKDIAEATQILRIVRANAPGGYGRRPIPDAARIPVDRLRTGLAPGELTADGLVPGGVEDYLLEGGPNVINLLRIHGEQQVMLRVTVAEVNRAAARSIGLDFTILNNSGQTVFANNTGSIATGGLTLLNTAFGGFGLFGGNLNNITGISPIPGVVVGAGGFNNLPAALDNGQVRLAINALRTLDYARSLAEPNLVTMNGQTASFQAGGQFPVPIVTGYTVNGLQGVNFIPYGVQLSFTPYITDRDRIRLSVAAEVSSRDVAAGFININGAAIPNLTTRNFQTVVELREGQTLAVAGLIQNNLGADARRVPFFGDLPFVGRLFAFDRITAGEQELVVLITPELVHPLEAKEVPALPGSDLFEPSDLEFYLWGRLESHRPFDYRSPVRTDLQRMRNYRVIEQYYLSGPTGTCD
jgi:pilus assembly protein CpaC